jgi:5-keto 4-deoxyuronate isomerase
MDQLVRLDRQVKDFKTDLFRISWYMRGGVTMDQLLFVYSAEDREILQGIINDNIKATVDARMPLV